MTRLDQTAVRALQALLAGQPTTDAKVVFAWTIAAGPVLSRAATVRWSETGTLQVAARSDAWRQEVTRARPLIVRRMNELLGTELVRRIAIDAAPDHQLASNTVPHPRG
jgi:hypothetical protein